MDLYRCPNKGQIQEKKGQYREYIYYRVTGRRDKSIHTRSLVAVGDLYYLYNIGQAQKRDIGKCRVS